MITLPWYKIFHRMKKMMLIVVAVAGFTMAVTAQKTNRTIVDPRLNREVLFGKCDREGLKTGEMGETFQDFYDAYHPDQEVIGNLTPLLEKTRIFVVLGSWCSDSQEQLPAFLKVLDQCDYPSSRVKMICVNRDKLAGKIDLKGYGIEKVPTFIFFNKGKETGRIVETPVVTLEQDMLDILAGSLP